MVGVGVVALCVPLNLYLCICEALKISITAAVPSSTLIRLFNNVLDVAIQMRYHRCL